MTPYVLLLAYDTQRRGPEPRGPPFQEVPRVVQKSFTDLRHTAWTYKRGGCMFQFNDSAPDEAITPGMRLVRTPSKGKVDAIIVSAKAIGTWTHYWRKRTIPHDDSACEPCQNGNSPRWHAWVTIWLPRTKELCIFETTAQASRAFDKYYAAEGTLRGAKMFAWRPSESENGRVFLRLERWSNTTEDLPCDIDLAHQLRIIWGMHANAKPLAPRNEEYEAFKDLVGKNGSNGQTAR